MADLVGDLELAEPGAPPRPSQLLVVLGDVSSSQAQLASQSPTAAVATRDGSTHAATPGGLDELKECGIAADGDLNDAEIAILLQLCNRAQLDVLPPRVRLAEQVPAAASTPAVAVDLVQEPGWVADVTGDDDPSTVDDTTDREDGAEQRRRPSISSVDLPAQPPVDGLSPRPEPTLPAAGPGPAHASVEDSGRAAAAEEPSAPAAAAPAGRPLSRRMAALQVEITEAKRKGFAIANVSNKDASDQAIRLYLENSAFERHCHRALCVGY
jgi:hypothetical protein